jgi:hypothetical protein
MICDPWTIRNSWMNTVIYLASGQKRGRLRRERSDPKHERPLGRTVINCQDRISIHGHMSERSSSIEFVGTVYPDYQKTSLRREHAQPAIVIKIVFRKSVP